MTGSAKPISNFVKFSMPPRGDGLRTIGIKGMLLMVFTLGIYRFWYLTRLRKYFWSRISIGGTPMEFTGQPIELIAGLFIAIAILLPLYLVLFIASLGMDGGIFLTNFLGLALLWFLSQFAIFRARRYRLTRTLWRGLRFRQSGSGFYYALLSLLTWMLVILSLGLLWPMRRQILHRYRVNHTWYGMQRAAFNASYWPLIIHWLPVYLLFVAGFAFYIYTNNSAFIRLFDIGPTIFAADGIADAYSFNVMMLSITELGRSSLLLLLYILTVIGFAWPHYSTAELKHFFNNSRFGEIGFWLRLEVKNLQKIWLVYGFYLALLLGGVILLGGGSVYMLASTGSSIMAALLAIGLYLAAIVSYAVITLTVWRFRQWQAIANKLLLLNATRLPLIQADPQILTKKDGWGEGFADALDAGGF